MKFKITIPAQSLKIEIPAQEIEMDFQPILEVEPLPPIVIPPTEPIEPPVITEPEPSEVFDLDLFLSGRTGVVYLPDNISLIKSKGMIKPNGVSAIVGNLILAFVNWEVTPTQLFDLSGCPEFAVVGITFVTPPNRPICTGFPDKELFGWSRDTVQTGRFAWINGPEVKDKELVTFGLCRFGYSSNSEGRIYLIGKNIHHNGFNFTQIKNPYRGNLWLILQNVNVHNPIIEGPQSHYYSPTKIPVRIRVENGISKIISDNTYDQILTWVGYNSPNQRSIIYFGKYVYDISDYKLIDNKTLNLDYPDELQIGDVTENGKVIQKQIGKNWTYSYNATNEPHRRTLPIGEFDAFICYKGNAMFNNGHLAEFTQFPEYEVTSSQGYGWSWYNEEFSGYIENFHGTGYFRNSGGSGVTNGLTIRNSTFESNPPIATANNDMPQEAQSYIEYLESL